MTDDADVILRAQAISKVFGAYRRANGVEFNVYRGRVNALVGENGAGKSTLMGILAGVHQPTSGRILLEGKPVELHLAARRRRARASASSTRRSCSSRTSASPRTCSLETSFALPTGVRLREQERRAGSSSRRLGQSVSPRAIMGELPVGIQQIVVICRALAQEVRC